MAITVLQSAAYCIIILVASALPTLTDVFVGGKEGYACYRIPALLNLPTGDLLAFAEGRLFNCGDHGYVDLVSKRSTNGGSTWGPLRLVWNESSPVSNVTVGNPAPLVDTQNSKVLLPFSRNNIEIGLLVSSDWGLTWAAPTSIPVPADWGWVATGPPGGLQLSSGRLIIPCDHYHTSQDTYYSHTIVSDDHGATWQTSTFVANGNECQAAALSWLSVNTVLLNMRSSNLKTRQVSSSTDGGLTWGAPTPIIAETECEGSMVALPLHAGGPLLVMSSAYDATNRVNMTLHASTDGRIWSPVEQVYAQGSAYSSLAVMHDGPTGSSVGLLFERDGYAAIAFTELAV